MKKDSQNPPYKNEGARQDPIKKRRPVTFSGPIPSMVAPFDHVRNEEDDFLPMPHQSRVQWQYLGVPIIPKPEIPYSIPLEKKNGKDDQSRYTMTSHEKKEGNMTNSNVESTKHFILNQYPEFVRNQSVLRSQTLSSSNMNKNSVAAHILERSIYRWPVFDDDDVT